jgi:hypothetical protein
MDEKPCPKLNPNVDISVLEGDFSAKLVKRSIKPNIIQPNSNKISRHRRRFDNLILIKNEFLLTPVDSQTYYL